MCRNATTRATTIGCETGLRPHTPAGMKLRHIGIFQASTSTDLSAPPRPQRVAALRVEDAAPCGSVLGFQLFQRTNGGLVPTEDAHSLFAEVREIQDRV